MSSEIEENQVQITVNDYHDGCSRYKKKELEKLVHELRTEDWNFQIQVDNKAKKHLTNLLYDYFLTHHDGKEKHKVESNYAIIKGFHKQLHFNYSRWCSVARQKYDAKKLYSLQCQTYVDILPNSDHEESVMACAKEVMKSNQEVSQNVNMKARLQNIVADMLLLLMVWGEIDIVRSQNNICNLLYHSAKKFLTDRNKAAQSKTKNNSDKAEIFTSVGSYIRHEACFLYNLVKQVGFNRLQRNEHFLAWDDINTICWTPGFVSAYLKCHSFSIAFRFTSDSLLLKEIEKEVRKIDTQINDMRVQEISHIISFLPSSDMKNVTNVCTKWKSAIESETKKPANSLFCAPPIPHCSGTNKIVHNENVIKSNSYINRGSNSQSIDSKQKEKKIAMERKLFVETWKTYFDRAGGFQGWRGYLTMLSNYSIVIYLQLIFLALMMYIFIEFPSFKSRPTLILPVCAVPIIILVTFFIIDFFFLRWRTKAFKHPYGLQLPRRDSQISRRKHFLNHLLWFFIFLSQVIVVRLLVFHNLHEATRTVIYQISKNQFSILSITALFISWLPIFLIFWTVTPVVFTIWKAFFGFIYAIKIGANYITTYGDFKNKMRQNQTLIQFQKKLLGPKNQKLTIEQVQYRFSVFFNHIIEDFYNDCLCSLSEKNRLSFHIEESHHVVRKIPTSDFHEQLRRITTVQPCNEELRFHLIKWMNNLYMNMPKDCTVENMKRLCVMTPVYKESVLYSWNELISLTNTNSCFLQHLIRKYPHDWNNFKNLKENLRWKEIISHIEKKLNANVDMRGHYVPDELIEKIRFWAGNHFQPVSRTVAGMTKIPRALKLLLKLQTLNPDTGIQQYSDEMMDDIIKDKFVMICGAQVMDKSTWREGENNSQYVEDFMLLLRKYGNFMKLAFQKKVGKRFVGVLLRKNEKSGNVEQEYEINLFGKFDSMGQGKPSHQAFMTQFFDGSIIEAIDCNQDAVLCQCAFIPNVLREFHHNSRLKVLGFPEYIFTEKWSHAGYCAAFTEKVFGTMIQRSWALLSMRMHYGHPDFVDGLWVMFCTGMSQLSYVSEDIFSGFDTLLNGGEIGYVEYIICGKARDVCLFTTSKFNRKISGGAAQVGTCRQIRELMTSWQFTLAEKLSLAYTTIAHYFNTVLIVLSTFVLFFIRIIVLTLRVFELESNDDATSAVWRVIDYLFIVQLGTMLSFPGFLQMVLDFGLIKAIWEFFFKFKFILISVYSVFHLLNTAIYFHYGFVDAAQYLASGRGAGLDHESIGKIIATFDSTHFVPSIVLLLYGIVGLALGGSLLFFVYNVMLGGIWLWSPFLFNRGSFPIGVDYETWAFQFNKDLDYVKKWKVKHIISELSKRTKNIQKIERGCGKDDSHDARVHDSLWLSDVHEDGQDPKNDHDIEDHLIAISVEQIVTNDEDEKIFKRKQEKKFNRRIIYKLNQIRQNMRALTWNFFLLITLAGIKYITIFYEIWKLLNPTASPPSRRTFLAEHDANERRFLHLQQSIKKLESNKFSVDNNETHFQKMQHSYEELLKESSISQSRLTKQIYVKENKEKSTWRRTKKILGDDSCEGMKKFEGNADRLDREIA